jgi:hypothetical protein
MSYTSLLTSDITYWAPSTPDGYGGLAYAAPATIKGRVQAENIAYQDEAGEEFVSASVVYTLTQLAHNGWIYKGVSATADPQDVEGAYIVRRIYTTADPTEGTIVYKAILGRAG